MEGILFRPMRKGDIEAVAMIEKLCFRSPWTQGMLRGELRNKAAHYHVLEYENEVIAYAGMWVVFDEAHITNVAVLPAYRRRGLANIIMLRSMQSAAFLGAKSMTLEVRTSNIGAQTLYEKLDFDHAGLRKGYYTDTGEDAILMWNYSIKDTLQKWNMGINL